jgi:hypothetical protein
VCACYCRRLWLYTNSLVKFIHQWWYCKFDITVVKYYICHKTWAYQTILMEGTFTDAILNMSQRVVCVCACYCRRLWLYYLAIKHELVSMCVLISFSCCFPSFPSLPISHLLHPTCDMIATLNIITTKCIFVLVCHFFTDVCSFHYGCCNPNLTFY